MSSLFREREREQVVSVSLLSFHDRWLPSLKQRIAGIQTNKPIVKAIKSPILAVKREEEATNRCRERKKGFRKTYIEKQCS